jgi:thiosulfate reductase cytochrome b subunit
MTSDAIPLSAAPEAKAEPPRLSVPRHRLIVRITHWINVLALSLMLLTGLNIFNAHPALYWGMASSFDRPWLSLTAVNTAHGLKGVTQIGPYSLDTTGVLGASNEMGMLAPRGFPAWATLPHTTYLSDARNWHFFWAWIFAVNLAVYILSGLINRHLARDVVPHGKDLRNLWNDVADHLRLRFHKGGAALRYGPLQRIAYTVTALVILPLIVLTGMTMSPGLDARFPFLLDVFGGRQSARSIHFICAMLAVGFILIHLIMVLLTGPLNQVRGMITGSFKIVDDRKEGGHEPA